MTTIHLDNEKSTVNALGSDRRIACSFYFVVHARINSVCVCVCVDR